MASYAQNFEDVMLWRALGHVSSGFYIDIGAQDPVIDSVSLGFYEHGWRGVHVEPTPAYAQALREARVDETVVQVAIGTSAELIPFFEIPNTGISTGVPDVAARHEAAGFALKRIDIPCIRLATLLDKYKDRDIHWMKIDVEGMEQSVLESWPPSQVRPWIVVLESTLPLSTDKAHDRWEHLILALDYRFAYSDGLNRFYVSSEHGELLAAFSEPPNVFDGFVLAGTSSATFCSRLTGQIAQAADEIGQLKGRQAELEAQLLQDIPVRQQLEQQREDFRLVLAEQDKALRSAYESTQNDRRQAELEWRNELRDALGERERALRAELDATHATELERERSRLQDELHTRLDETRELFTTQLDAVRTELHAAELLRVRHETQVEATRNQLLEQDKAFRHALEAKRDEHQQAELRLQHAHETRLQAALTEQRQAFDVQLDTWRRTLGSRLLLAFGSRRRLEVVYPSTVAPPPQDVSVLPRSAEPHSTEERPGFAQHTNKEILMLDDLLVLNGASFVQAAYRTVLKREADPSGELNYTTLLTMGVDKLVVLDALAQSDEGKRAGVLIPGLSAALRRRRLARIPFIGPLAKGILSVFRRGPARDPIRALHAQLIQAQQRTLADVSIVQASMSELGRQQDRLERAVRSLSDQQDEIRVFLLWMQGQGNPSAAGSPGQASPSMEPHPTLDVQLPENVQIQLIRKAAAWKI
ncbi:FkbM family methyltransferase [Sphaerotilaceae bacterium SBD11-9]